MKILIIGGAGFIGSNIARELIENDHIIYIYEIGNANLGRVEDFQDRITIISGDLKEFDHICSIVERYSIQIVFHLVSTLLPLSDKADYFREINQVISPTIRLLPYFAINKIKFIFFSSGGTIYGDNPKILVSEDEVPRPINYYGQSKLLLEESILFESKYSGLEYLIIRPSNPYGRGQNFNGKQGIIAVCIGKILNGEKITIWGDGNIVRDYVCISDLCHAINELLKKDIKNKIVNIGSGVGFSINQIIEILKSKIATRIDVEYTEGRSVDVKSLILDISYLRRIIDYNPKPLIQGIEDFLKSVFELKDKG